MSTQDDHLCAYYGKAEKDSAGAIQKLATVGCKEDLCQLDISKSATGDVSVKAGGCADVDYTQKDVTTGKDYSCYRKSADESFICFCIV